MRPKNPFGALLNKAAPPAAAPSGVPAAPPVAAPAVHLVVVPGLAPVPEPEPITYGDVARDLAELQPPLFYLCKGGDVVFVVAVARLLSCLDQGLMMGLLIITLWYTAHKAEIQRPLVELEGWLKHPGNQLPKRDPSNEGTAKLYHDSFEKQMAALVRYYAVVGQVCADLKAYQESLSARPGYYSPPVQGALHNAHREVLLFLQRAWEALYRYGANQKTWDDSIYAMVGVGDLKKKVKVDHIIPEFWQAVYGGPLGFLFPWMQGTLSKMIPENTMALQGFHAACAAVQLGDWENLGTILGFIRTRKAGSGETTRKDARAADPVVAFYAQLEKKLAKKVEKGSFGQAYDELFKPIFNQPISRTGVSIINLVATIHTRGGNTVETIDWLHRGVKKEEGRISKDAVMQTRGNLVSRMVGGIQHGENTQLAADTAYWNLLNTTTGNHAENLHKSVATRYREAKAAAAALHPGGLIDYAAEELRKIQPFTDRNQERDITIQMNRLMALWGKILDAREAYDKVAKKLSETNDYICTAEAGDAARKTEIAKLEDELKRWRAEREKISAELERMRPDGEVTKITLRQINRKGSVPVTYVRKDGTTAKHNVLTMSPFRITVPEGVVLSTQEEEERFLRATFAAHTAGDRFVGWLQQNPSIREGIYLSPEIRIGQLDGGRPVIARERPAREGGAILSGVTDIIELLEEFARCLEAVFRRFGAGGKAAVHIPFGILTKYDDLVKESRLDAAYPPEVDVRRIGEKLRAELALLQKKQREATPGSNVRNTANRALAAFGDVNVRIKEECDKAVKALGEERVEEFYDSLRASHDYFARLRAIFAFCIDTAEMLKVRRDALIREHLSEFDLDFARKWWSASDVDIRHEADRHYLAAEEAAAEALHAFLAAREQIPRDDYVWAKFAERIRQHLDPSFADDLAKGITALEPEYRSKLELPDIDQGLVKEFWGKSDQEVATEAARLKSTEAELTMADKVAGRTQEEIKRRTDAAHAKARKLRAYLVNRQEYFEKTRPDQVMELKERISRFLSILFGYRYGYEVGDAEKRPICEGGRAVYTASWLDRRSAVQRTKDAEWCVADAATREREDKLKELRSMTKANLSSTKAALEAQFRASGAALLPLVAELAEALPPFLEVRQVVATLAKEGRVDTVVSSGDILSDLLLMIPMMERYNTVVGETSAAIEEDQYNTTVRRVVDDWFFRAYQAYQEQLERAVSEGSPLPARPEMNLHQPCRDIVKEHLTEVRDSISSLLRGFSGDEEPSESSELRFTHTGGMSRAEKKVTERVNARARMEASASKTRAAPAPKARAAPAAVAAPSLTAANLKVRLGLLEEFFKERLEKKNKTSELRELCKKACEAVKSICEDAASLAAADVALEAAERAVITVYEAQVKSLEEAGFTQVESARGKGKGQRPQGQRPQGQRDEAPRGTSAGAGGAPPPRRK